MKGIANFSWGNQAAALNCLGQIDGGLSDLEGWNY